MRTVTVVLPEEMIEHINELLLTEIFPSKSELIRAAIRDFLQAHGAFESSFKLK